MSFAIVEYIPVRRTAFKSPLVRRVLSAAVCGRRLAAVDLRSKKVNKASNTMRNLTRKIHQNVKTDVKVEGKIIKKERKPRKRGCNRLSHLCRDQTAEGSGW
jgi:hypothetical protein